MSSSLAGAEGQGSFGFAHADGLLLKHVRGGSIRIWNFGRPFEICLHVLSEPDAGTLYDVHLFAPCGDGIVLKKARVK
jgi:hypothetical protein